jgi:hypothetical protein
VKFASAIFPPSQDGFDTYPGAFGRSGSHGESAWSQSEEAESGLLRAHWIIGPPFVDRKSLATMSNAC